MMDFQYPQFFLMLDILRALWSIVWVVYEKGEQDDMEPLSLASF